MFARTSLYRWAPALLCALLIGCGVSTATTPTAAPPAQPTAAPPTTAPTIAPTVSVQTEALSAMPTKTPWAGIAPTGGVPTETLSAGPTKTPSAWPTETPWPVMTATATPAAVRLPAPLYFIDAKYQISRLEVDDKTITPVTNEAGSVSEFVVSPADGSLAYLMLDRDDPYTIRLIHSDGHGQARVELQTGVMRGLAIGYSGESVEVGVLDPAPNTQMTPAARTPGVWSFPMGRGTPTQIQAATPPTQGADGHTKPGEQYMPLAWSPDGQKLLLRTWNNPARDPIGGLALFEKPSGTVRQLLPAESDPMCISPSWDGQSVMVYCSTPALLNHKTPALWRLNIVSGEHETLIPSRDGKKTNLVFSVRELSDGLYSLVATSEANAPVDASALLALRFTLQRTALDGVSERKQLVAEPSALQPSALFLIPPLWAEAGSGVVIAADALTWYPLRGGEPVVLQSGPMSPYLVAWGKP